jgi:sulfoxide reductase heme-binding subunit YedZ
VVTRVQLFTRVIKPALFVTLPVPVLVLVWRGLTDNFGANPVEEITHETGLWALRILLLTLAISPLCRLSGISQWVRLRRMTGLYSFFYACLHFATYAWLDQGFDPELIFTDVLKRPYISFGFAAFVLLIPLAATSINRVIRYMGGQRWKRLHRLVYLCATAGVLHYLWLVKADYLNPMIYLLVLAILLSLRIPEQARRWLLGSWRGLVRGGEPVSDRW